MLWDFHLLTLVGDDCRQPPQFSGDRKTLSPTFFLSLSAPDKEGASLFQCRPTMHPEPCWQAAKGHSRYHHPTRARPLWKRGGIERTSPRSPLLPRTEKRRFDRSRRRFHGAQQSHFEDTVAFNVQCMNVVYSCVDIQLYIYLISLTLGNIALGVQPARQSRFIHLLLLDPLLLSFFRGNKEKKRKEMLR